MFKFGFSHDNTEESKDVKDDEKTTKISWFPSSEIKVTTEQIKKEYYSPDEYIYAEVSGVFLKIIHSDNLVMRLTNKDHKNIIKAESQHSDLLPAVYEGGLKIWECSYDLGTYVFPTLVGLNGKKVLDLGCGAGIIGVLSLLKGSNVHFQDYNAEVLKLVTIPNVLLNLDNRQDVYKRCEFYSGDWASFTELLENKFTDHDDKYDLIFTSETIYNSENQKKLYDVFKKRLKNNGVGYVAGKTYYFGVGGGMRQFENLVKKDQVFDVKIVWRSSQGLQREIMMLKRRTSTATQPINEHSSNC